MNHSSNTPKHSWLGTAKVALAKRRKSTDFRGLDTKRSYASFWMDQDDDDRFGAVHDRAGTDLVKLVKLTAYRKAVTNFVKIVTKQEIPVLWHGDGSYTNGKSITLSTDIKDKTFDVTVGLALHEASHVVLTDFKFLGVLFGGSLNASQSDQVTYSEQLLRMRTLIGRGEVRGFTEHEVKALIKDVMNWVEDRRIDHFVFSTSPGYKAYYHKLYDYYWNSKEVLKGMLSTEYRDSSKLDSYLFHIFNMINPSFDRKALPGLSEIVGIVDLTNIARLNSIQDVFDVTIDIVNKIFDNVSKPTFPDIQMPDQQGNTKSASSSASSSDTPSDSTNQQSTPSDGDKNEQGNDGDDEQSGGEQVDGDQDKQSQSGPELDRSPGAANAARKVLADQRNFVRGALTKKRATKKLQKDLDKVANQSMEVDTVDFNGKAVSCLTLDYTNASKMAQFLSLYTDSNNKKLSMQQRLARETELASHQYFGIEPTDFCSQSMYHDHVAKGLELGGLLGKKLQLHNESRETVTNRLRNGKIDNRRLAHAGYGIESVFNQLRIDQCKPANVHLSIDGSGSMAGPKWYNTVQMTMAIAKAITYTQNVSLQVSIRATRGDNPCNILIYNSKKNNLGHLTNVLNHFYPRSGTPEGLCFEGLMRRGILKSGDRNLDSYFINISDGDPMGCGSYYGEPAWRHTRKQVDKMTQQLGMQVLSYYVEEKGWDNSETYRPVPSKQFKIMYGNSASAIDANSVIEIAKTMNRMFLSAKR